MSLNGGIYMGTAGNGSGGAVGSLPYRPGIRVPGSPAPYTYAGGGGVPPPMPKLATPVTKPTVVKAATPTKLPPAGGAPGAPGGGGAPGAPGTVGITTTSQVDPYLKKQIDTYQARLTSDPTNRAIERAGMEIRDAASGMAEEEKGNLAARGILNSGAGGKYLQKRVYDPAQRQIAKAAADISLGREGQLDALTLGGTSLMTEPGREALAQSDQALRAWAASQGMSLEQAKLAQQGSQFQATLTAEQQDQANKNMLAMNQMLLQAPSGSYGYGYGSGGYGYPSQPPAYPYY